MKDVLKRAGEMLTQNLIDYSDGIEKAYTMAEDKFKVTLGATFSPEGSGTKVKTEIAFVPEKVKDHSEAIVAANGESVQKELDLHFPEPSKAKITHSYAHKVKGHSAGARVRARGYTHR